MQRGLERTSSGTAWKFPLESFSVENLPFNKSRIALCQVMTSLGIQLGSLRTVSPRGCHWRSLWSHPVLRVDLPRELCFSQNTMVIRFPWHMALSQQEGGRCCIMRDVGKAGMSAHREGRGHKAYQLQLPRGSISELKWRALGQTFSLFGKISTFSTGKENKNTMKKKENKAFFSPDLSSQDLRNYPPLPSKDWVVIKTHKKLRVGARYCLGLIRPLD